MSIINNKIVANIAKAAVASFVVEAVTATGKRESQRVPHDIREAQRAQRRMHENGETGLCLVLVDGVVENPYKPNETCRRIGSFKNNLQCVQRLILIRERYGYKGGAFIVSQDMMIRIDEDTERKVYLTQDPEQRKEIPVFPWETKDWTFRLKKPVVHTEVTPTSNVNPSHQGAPEDAIGECNITDAERTQTRD